MWAAGGAERTGRPLWSLHRWTEDRNTHGHQVHSLWHSLVFSLFWWWFRGNLVSPQEKQPRQTPMVTDDADAACRFHPLPFLHSLLEEEEEEDDLWPREGGAYLQVEGSSWFGHLTQEVLWETRAQDVLSVRLIGVKGHFLSVISDNIRLEWIQLNCHCTCHKCRAGSELNTNVDYMDILHTVCIYIYIWTHLYTYIYRYIYIYACLIYI